VTDSFSAGDPRRFLREGRLETMPRRLRDRIPLLRYLATQAMPELLEPVTERELTDRLAELTDDPVGLRRAMVDFGVVRRTRDGAEYWRTERTEHDPDTAVEQAVDRMLDDEQGEGA
jgi:hypothetical protein